MNRAGKLLFLIAFVQLLSAGVSYGLESYVYATTNMTWAEFYAGEVDATSADLLSAGLDAISTPTTHGLARFPLLLGESGDNGTTITGLKGVQVRLSETLYNSLADKSRYTVSASSFDEYKDVNSDGTFGKMVSTSTNATASGATVKLATGSSARWGHYVFSVSSADIEIGSANRYCDYYLGALLETSDGKIYGMRHDNNLWSNTDLAFTVNANYTEPHGLGTKRFYQYTSDLEGKTVTKITYMLKNKPDVVLSGLNIYLKKRTDATIRPSQTFTPTSADIKAALIFSNIPDGAEYTLDSVTKALGRGATSLISGTDYTYDSANKVLTILGGSEETNYTATFTSDKYADLSAVIEVGNFHYATTDMTWAEFYAAEVGEPFSEDLYSAGLDAISSPTSRVANRFSQLTSKSNDIGGRDIIGVKAVQVRMTETVYNILSNDSRYTLSTEAFTEYKDVNEDGSFGKMVSETHTQNGAIVTLTAPGTWGDYQLEVSSIDITVSSGDENYYLGALVETSDGKIHGMRHNNNLWFNAKDLAISTAKFVEPHGISRSYKYTSDMEGKTITKITYMLKNLPDEIVNCNVFLKHKTSASVSPKYSDGWHAVMTTGDSLDITLVFRNVPSSADYKLSGLTLGTGRNRKAVTGCTYSGNVLKLNAPSEGTYTATFTDKNYCNISATINVFTVNATDKVVSADRNAAGLNFLLTPSGVIDSVDSDMAANKFVPASDYTDPDSNSTASYTAGYHEIAGTGFSFDIALNDVPSGYMGIVGFGLMAHLTPENCGELYPSIYAAINALPTGASGYKEVSSVTQLKPLGIRAISVQPDGTLRDVSEFTGAGVMILSSSDIMIYYGTMMADCASSDIAEGEHMLSPEGENIIADGKADGHIRGTIYLEIMQTVIELIDDSSNLAEIQFDTLPAGFIESADANVRAKGITWIDERNVKSGGSSAFVTGKTNQLSGNSGYTFTIPYDINSIPSGHVAALGFERSFYFTESNLGASGYSALVSAMSSMTKIPGYEWRMPKASELQALGLAIVAEYHNGTSRDVTGESSIGLLAMSDRVLMQYGAIAVDRALTANEGDILDMVMEKTPLVSDGLADGKITVTWYITRKTGSTPSPASEDVNPNPAPESGDKKGSGTSTVTPGKTSIPLTESKKADIRNALSKLSGKVSSTTEVAELPSSSFIGTQTATNSDSVMYLPIIEVSEDKVYVLGVSLDKFAQNTSIHWHSNAQDKVTGDFLSAADNDEAAIFMNDDGDEVSTVPANNHVNVAAYFEKNKTYYPTITTTEEQSYEYGVRRASGGCNFGISAMLLGLGFFIARKK